MLTVAVAVLAISTQASQNLPRNFQYPELMCSLSSNVINESSGIGASRAEDGMFFTHNDSGDSARFFKFDSTGKVLGSFALQGATAIDWEDMATAVVDGIPYVYIGDIGDNLRIRTSIKVHRLLEPLQSQGTITKFETYTLTYPDRAHNAETLMVRPQTGDIYIVTKISGEDSKVFKCPKPDGSGNYVLQEVGRLRIGTNMGATQLITGGDISGDGKYVVIRGMYAAHEFKAPAGNFDGWCNEPRTNITLRPEGQGEAICYSRTGTTLYTTSEGTPCPVTKITMKKKG
ncbi:MAG: hypothetical protein HONBIEJF_01309 [Fimbriimonadaceae bacterium]|nr:hypothetical protein [Fimbriimonadaceae bacterium]